MYMSICDLVLYLCPNGCDCPMLSSKGEGLRLLLFTRMNLYGGSRGYRVARMKALAPEGHAI